MKCNHDKGFSLVEILVALVVLSIGLLGLAALQVVGLRSANSSGYRSIAVTLASDIADRMNANPAAVNFNNADINGDGVVDVTGPFVAFDSAGVDCTVAPAAYCSDYYNGTSNQASAVCTPQQMGTFDLNVLYCGELSGANRVGGIANLLPNGSLTVVCIDAGCANGSRHTVTISWDEVQTNGPATTKNVSMTFIPRARI